MLYVYLLINSQLCLLVTVAMVMIKTVTNMAARCHFAVYAVDEEQKTYTCLSLNN